MKQKRPRKVAQAEREESSCSQPGQRQYRKSIASTGFLIVNPQHVSDLDNVWEGLPRELMRRLESAASLLPTVVTRSSLFSNPTPAQRFEADPELVRRLAQTSNSQFVVAGRLLDAGVSEHKTRPLADWQGDSGVPGHSSRFEQGWQNESGGTTQSATVQLPGMPWHMGIANQPSQRRIEVELLLYEGASGILLQRIRAAETAVGKVMVGRENPFGSQRYYQSDFGQATSRLLDSLARKLEQATSCLPMNSRIVRLAGKEAQIDSGTLQNLRPGDTLTIYAPDRNAPVYAGEPTVPLGLPEQPIGTLTIRSVQPRFSTGMIRPFAGKRIQAGDTARYEETPASGEQGQEATE